MGRFSGWRGESLLSIGRCESSRNRLLCHDPFLPPLAEPAPGAWLGLAWIALLASRAPTGSCHGATGSQVLVMLLLACSAYVPLLARAGQRAEATNVTTM